jgi:hypothetical protein
MTFPSTGPSERHTLIQLWLTRYISVSLQRARRLQSQTLVYRGSHWASLSGEAESELLTVYPAAIPLRDALASLDEARERLRRLG